MNLEDLLKIGKKVLGNAGTHGIHAAFEEGFILKTDSGDYFVRNINGRFEHWKIESEVDMQSYVRPMKLDMRGRLKDLRFPLRIPYSTFGFMGPLSGSAGDLTIYQDGHIEFNEIYVS